MQLPQPERDVVAQTLQAWQVFRSWQVALHVAHPSTYPLLPFTG